MSRTSMSRAARLLLRMSPLLGVAALTVLAVGGPAAAHVTVNPSTATQGGYAKLTFRVPNERDDASTTKLQVFFPTDHPLASVSVKPHPGWKYVVATKKLADPVTTESGQITEGVDSITWTPVASADAIKPGQFEEFDVSAGPLPDAPSLQFKALQTYSSGEVVRWIEPRVAGAAEPAHPAPILTLLPASESPSATTGTTSDAATASDSGPHSDGRATAALVVGVIGLVVALAGLGLGLLTRRRSRAA